MTQKIMGEALEYNMDAAPRYYRNYAGGEHL